MAKVYLTLKLDLGIATAVRALWRRLKEAGLPAPGHTGLRPHITLAGYDGVDPQAFGIPLQ